MSDDESLHDLERFDRGKNIFGNRVGLVVIVI